ncbi:hypothetical protein [Legionella jamestowniensis]|uniref:HTH cro/C1-type domain-containing protein n=1 Tax=Legionella jamestowniensis TaxID=455 RepID=A0A0W0UNB2_9GAMM|nr:hypothetical protein [Legionella jamestowniensis]KTD09311.1 hypothetical protein Ljam_0661 [Legionella jamestowniensis]SFL87419.1 hypothetical protein SAMN02746073_2329 [Legionella jamestowniensis DSM 19215]
MVCIVEFNDSFRFNFVRNRIKQKIWIEALLRLTNLDINHMAAILEIPAEVLTKVHHGEMDLSQECAECLGRLFLLAFSD